MDKESIQRIIDSWERGEPLASDDVETLVRALDRKDLSPETRTLLSIILRDTGRSKTVGIGPEEVGSADPKAVDDVMAKISGSNVVPFRADTNDRFSKIGLGIGAAAAGIAMLIGSVALLLHVTGSGPETSGIAAGQTPLETEAPNDAGHSPVILSDSGPESNSASLVVQFELVAPEAHSVSLVGDFNDWDSDRNPLTDDDKDGVWEVRIRVKPDEVYTYNFLVDEDEWIPDPNAMKDIRDAFGGRKSVLSL